MEAVLRTRVIARAGFWLRWLLGIVLWLSGLLLSGEPPVRVDSRAQPPPAVEAAAANTSWPQVQGDANHSGYVPQTVSSPYRRLWQVNTAPVSSRVQPIIAGGLVFLPSNDGCLYAYSALNGAQAWRYCTRGALVNSAAYAAGRVFFGSTDRSIYALDVTTSTATLAWSYETGGAVKTAPVLDASRVYMGSSDGGMYALNQAGGSLAWPPRNIGAPIYDTAAYDNGMVFFGGMDSVGYALNASDGTIAWQKPIPGIGFRDRWTVAGNGDVFFTPMLFGSHHEALNNGTLLFYANANPVIYNQPFTPTQRATILNDLSANPFLQPLFVFTEAGVTPFTPPVLYASGGSKSAQAQVVLLPNGDANVIYRRSFGQASQYGATTNDALFTGELVLTTTIPGQTVGNISPVDTCTPGSGWDNCGSYKSAFTSDESAALVRSGNVIYLDIARGTYGLDTVNHVALPTVAVYNPTSGGPFALAGVPVTYSDYVNVAGGYGWRVDPANIRSEVDSDGNDLKRPTPVVGDTLYIFHYDTLSAVQGTVVAGSVAQGPSAQAPSLQAESAPATAAPGPASAAPGVVHAAEQLPGPWARAELEKRVDEMVTLGHMAPTLYFSGLGGGGQLDWPAIFYATPGETVYTLSAAYPYLSAGLQSRLKAYLDNELRVYPPQTQGYYPPNASTKLTDLVGARREYFAVRPDLGFNFYPGVPINVSALYAVWLYSQNTGDWSYATTNYSGLKAVYTAYKSQSGGVINNYPALAGVLGWARIAQHTNHSADYADAWALAQQGETLGADFNTFLATAQAAFPAGNQSYTAQPFMFYRNPVALHFDADIGNLLHDQAQSAVRAYATRLEHDLPLWWLTSPAMSHGENAFATPEIGWTNFMLHAYALGDSATQLQQYLVDAPDRKGDLLYMQKLVALLDTSGGGGPDLSSSTKTASNLVPQTGVPFTYTVVIRNTGAPFTNTVTFTDTLPAELGYVANSLAATSGTVTPPSGNPAVLGWSGVISATGIVTVTYEATVSLPPSQGAFLTNAAVVFSPPVGSLNLMVTVLGNGRRLFLPYVAR